MGDQRIGCHGTFGYRTKPLQTGNGRSRMPKPVVGRAKVSTADALLRLCRPARVPDAGSVGGSPAPRSNIAGAQEAPRKACGAPYLPAKLATPREARSHRNFTTEEPVGNPPPPLLQPAPAAATPELARDSPQTIGRACRDRHRRSGAVSATLDARFIRCELCGGF